MSSSSIDFAGYNFPEDKGCFACQHVMDGVPVLLFVHETDGDLQFMCGAPGHEYAECVLLHASQLLEAQPDLAMLPTVDLGFQAERVNADSPWIVSPIPQHEYVSFRPIPAISG
jgi:hypothetical protein